jgi:Transposase DNA-binding/Transposase Tn5 dimerisation domain
MTTQSWTEEELRTADFNDKRLDRRFKLIVDRLSRKPSHKFTTACRGRAEVKAAYRFANNRRVAADGILEPHEDATRQRIAECPVVVLSQDTSEVDLTRPNEKIKGGGPLNEADRIGFYFHPLLALTPDRVPLGVIDTLIWARDADEFDVPAQDKAKQRKKKPIEEKESLRWLTGYRAACEVATECPKTQIIVVSDSESDIFECIEEGRQPPASGQRKADWIIRACQDRAVLLPATQKEDGKRQKTQTSHLFAEVARTAVLYYLTLEVSKRKPKSHDGRKRKQPRSARKAVVSVQAAKVKLRGPYRPGGKLDDIEVNAVLLREEKPPEGEPPIEWLLLTNLSIDSKEAVQAVIDYYCCRWQIEIYFRVVKSGCKVETSQLETAEAFQAYLALCMIVAWRVMYLMMLGRECPDMPADSVLEEDEWQSVYAVVKGETPPEQAPSLGVLVKLIAALGGYLGRPSDGPPGPKAMWVGMQRMTDLALGWRARAQRQQPPTSATHSPPTAAAPVPSPREPTTAKRCGVR